jgi:N-dimethylarginine dimethylaminohydrolase
VRNQRLYRARGFVLKRMDLGEADRILTLYTREHGKLRAVAKGVRKTTSRSAGHLEPFILTDLSLAVGKELDVIAQAETKHAFREVREDLVLTTHAYYLAELTDLLTEDRMDNRAVFDALVQALREEDVEIVFLDECAPGRMKSVYTRDSVIAVDGGAIVCRLGTRYRRGEELAVSRKLGKLGMPCLRTIHGTGILEGGSFAWLDEKTAVLGLSTRVNDEGARQLEEVLRVTGVELIRVDLTGYRQHIDGLLVMLDVGTVLINPVLTPYRLIERLMAMRFKIIELHPEDHAFTINCLAVAPGRVVMSEASRRTLDRLDREGITVLPVPFDAVYRGGGGIHCSTAPLVRDPVA